MNKPGSRNYRSNYEADSFATNFVSFDTKKGGHLASNNNNSLFYYNNVPNATSIVTTTNTNSAPRQVPYSSSNNTLTYPGASEEYLTYESLTHYMNLPIEADLAALSFTRALVYPPNSNQVMNPIHIQVVLGPGSFETPMYPTTTTSIAAVPTTPPATTMVDTENTYYGTFEAPYPATLQTFQDPSFFAPDQQQPPPYPSLGSPPPPMWAPQPHEAVRALYNSPLNTTTTLQHPLQPQPLQQLQQQEQLYNPHSLHYGHHHHLHVHQHQEGVSPHILSDPALSPPPLPHLMSPYTEPDDSVSTQSTSSSSYFSSDEDEDECVEVKTEGGPSMPLSFPTKPLSYRKKTNTNNKRRTPTTASLGPVPKHPKHPKPVKTSKVKPKMNANAAAKPPGKLHPCKECGRLFTRACNLQSHQTTHLRQKPFPCPDCCLAFARVYDMKRHHRIHTNLRPYQCAACPEAFKRIEARERHFLAHHGYPAQGV
ncbi:hypothetical protein BGZ96_006182 [Linnemannia gamsii]|uniref:C2H2-type domain-containing protein n=1 Tax=Linnemannia gamsii TaxID=64522 RepID=A0ABQ7K4D8_9FUNG|nr:hypothetical protein BGZ96_006182 [Linnemannia gamsii]